MSNPQNDKLTERQQKKYKFKPIKQYRIEIDYFYRLKGAKYGSIMWVSWKKAHLYLNLKRFNCLMWDQENLVIT